VEAPGVIANRSDGNRLLLGAVDPRFSARVAPLADALRTAGVDPGDGQPIRTPIWKKLMYTMCMGPIASLTGLRNGLIRTDPDLIALMDKLSLEGVAIAHSHGQQVSARIEIPATGPIANHKQSMLQDLEKGHPVEYAPIIGLPRAYAHAAGIPCPTIDAVATLLKGRLVGAGLLGPQG
jgi:2-dehydropantoate 2-reductase